MSLISHSTPNSTALLPLKFFLLNYSWLTVLCPFPLYGIGTRSYIYIHILFHILSSILFYPKRLDIGPCAVQLPRKPSLLIHLHTSYHNKGIMTVILLLGSSKWHKWAYSTSSPIFFSGPCKYRGLTWYSTSYLSTARVVTAVAAAAVLVFRDQWHIKQAPSPSSSGLNLQEQ